MSNCSENVKDLKRENEKLTQMRGSVVVGAKEKGDRLKDGVEEWAVDIESHISEAKEVIDWGEENANKTCFNLGMSTDLGTLYHHGICTTSGVGKTTLAKEVAVTVKSLFDPVEFITVSQTIDAEKIIKEVEAAV
nr:hypothetical protein [Tanacetum cinerariifolium]